MFYLYAYQHSYLSSFFISILLVLGPRRWKEIVLKRQTVNTVVTSVKIMLSKLSHVSLHVVNTVGAVLIQGTVESPMEGTIYKTVATFCFYFCIYSFKICRHCMCVDISLCVYMCICLHVPIMLMSASQIGHHWTALVLRHLYLTISASLAPESPRDPSASVF